MASGQTVLSPFVYWGQSNETVSLKVDLRNVENVEVNLTEEGLDFSAQGTGVKGVNEYKFHLDFYLPVDPEKSRYRKTDLAVEFQIEKVGGETWPRLTHDRIKLPWLKIDFDKFPLDDSGEENDKNIQEQYDEAMIDKITTELASKPKREKSLSMAQNYLLLYNLFQFVGYMYILSTLLFSYVKNGADAKQGAFEAVGTQLMVCQSMAFLEVVHPLLGLVKSQVLTSLLQVVAKSFVLFMLILQEPRLQISPLCWYLFVVWSTVEVVRYPFYMLQVAGIELRYLTWLRYTLWIPLYPTGILIEATIVYICIYYFAETGFFSTSLPNTANMSFYFPYFLAAYLVLLGIGGTNMLNHMRRQRSKILYSAKATYRKSKSS